MNFFLNKHKILNFDKSKYSNLLNSEKNEIKCYFDNDKDYQNFKEKKSKF